MGNVVEVCLQRRQRQDVDDTGWRKVVNGGRGGQALVGKSGLFVNYLYSDTVTRGIWYCKEHPGASEKISF